MKKNLNLLLVLNFALILNGCKNDKPASRTSNTPIGESWTGVGCGGVNANHGVIRLLSEIDNNTYILMGINKDKTLIENGIFDISDNDNIEVSLLDFNTKLKQYEIYKGDTLGYVFPCSDISSNYWQPDRLDFLKGIIRIEVQSIEPLKKRRYKINIMKAKFILEDKVKEIDKYEGKVLFEDGFPG